MADPTGQRYRGEVVYLYAYDVAYDMKREPVKALLGQPVTPLVVEADRRGPREQFFYLPQMAKLPPEQTFGPLGEVAIERTVKLFPVGAVSVCMRVKFEVDRLEDLAVMHDAEFLRAGEAHPTKLAHEARRLVESIRLELQHLYIRPIGALREEEAYTIFCIHCPLPDALKTEDWLAANRARVTALLLQEHAPERLSLQETHDTTDRYLSYYNHDLVVADWDAALVVDEPGAFAPTLHIMELANVQLAELEAYDRILDDALQTAYRDLSAGPGARWRRAAVLSRIREFRIDMARLSDEMSNTTKFFGDWHLARVYHTLSARFHLTDWRHTLDDKIKTLDELYSLLKQDVMNRWMMVLEIAIVVLFVIEVVRAIISH